MTQRKFFTTRDITVPKDGLVVYKNAWWICDGDATKALFYGTSPQCNANKSLSEYSLESDMYKKFSDNLKIVFVETAFVPQRN